MGARVSTPDYSQYSPLALAYIGDAVYDLIIRDKVVRKGSRQVQKLHRETIHYVNAGAQSELILRLLDSLTPEETAVYKRGRNAVSHTVPKNQDVGDYRRATGFEALLGWLFLEGQYDRILELTGEADSTRLAQALGALNGESGSGASGSGAGKAPEGETSGEEA